MGKRIKCPHCGEVTLAAETARPIQRNAAQPAMVKPLPMETAPYDDGMANMQHSFPVHAGVFGYDHRRKMNPYLITIAIGLAAMMLLMCSGLLLSFIMQGNSVDARAKDQSGIAKSLSDLADKEAKLGTDEAKTEKSNLAQLDKGAFPESNIVVVMPDFPPMSAGMMVGSVKVHEIDLGKLNDRPLPGFQMKMRIYVPTKNLGPRSRPCVLVAPAGTPLVHGSPIDDGDYHDESMPYAAAGMIAVCYSIDGHMPDREDWTEDEYFPALKKANAKFRAAHAGIVNAKIALQYALAKIPFVDPTRIYAAGHSSAGTLSLQLAACEPRITKCIAYAPVTNLESHFADVMGEAQYLQGVPKLREFTEQYSPINLIDRYDCDVYIYHSLRDSVSPWQESNRFNTELKKQGKSSELVTGSNNDHYEGMIEEGIPQAILWLTNEKKE
jgi:dienelactone hydrolase